MKKITTLFLISLSLTLASVASAAEVNLNSTSSSNTSASVTAVSSGSVFTRNLTVGSSGQDVMALKKIISIELNTTIDTSASFTTNTANDVAKFQEKYAVEILIPNGLSSGTGFVGVSTRAKLNQLAPKYYVKLSDFTVPATTASTLKNVFTRTLQLGSTGDDVSLLKIILNSDPDTALNPKNSTNVFDSATEIAVNKFQEKYASEILAPTGLTSGVNVVGPATRKKLNSIINSILATAQAANASTTSNNSSLATNTSSNYPISYSTNNSSYTTPTNTIYTNPNTTPADGDIVSQTCSGTTLVTTKVGFGSTYVTTTPNSSLCASSIIYTPPVTSSSNNCSSFIYSAWGTCSNNTQTRTIISSSPSGCTSGSPILIQLCATNSTSNTSAFSSTTKQILSFNFPSKTFTNTVIDEKNHTITVYVPPKNKYEITTIGGSTAGGILSFLLNAPALKGSSQVDTPMYDVTSVAPTITFQGSSTSPASGVAQNFTNPVNYTVTALDGSTATYKVAVVPVTCPDYYKDGMPFGGTITNVFEVNLIGYGGEMGEKQPLWIYAGGNIPTLLSGYEVQIDSPADNNGATPVINTFCFDNGQPPQNGSYFYWNKPSIGASVLGTAYIQPTVWVNRQPHDCPTNILCLYDQLRIVKDSSSSY
jgi:hypothetical protein